MGRNEYDGEFDRFYEKGLETGKGKYGRVVVWPPEAATSDTEVPESVADSPEERPAYPGEAESASLGRGGLIPFLTFTGGERQRARGDVWDIRARRTRDILLTVLIWIVLGLVDTIFWGFGNLWAGIVSLAMGEAGGGFFMVLGITVFFITIFLMSLANHGVVLDRRTGTAWFWLGLLGLKKAKAVPFELLEVSIMDDVAGWSGEGRVVSLYGPGQRMRLYKGGDAQARAYRGELEDFFSGREIHFKYKGTLTQRDTAVWFVAGFCILLVLLLDYLY